MWLHFVGVAALVENPANPIRDTASDPNGTLAAKLDYITNKLTNVHRKLDSIAEGLDKWDAYWAKCEKEDEKTTK